MSETLTLEALRKKKKPNTETVYIAGDSESAELLAKAQEELKAAESVLRVAKSRQNNDVAIGIAEERVRRAEEALAAAKEEVGDSVLKFVFKAIGRKPFNDLVNDHQMSTERREAVLKQNNIKDSDLPTNWDPDTFPIACIAHTMVEPKLTYDEIVTWLNDDTWNEAELAELFRAAMNVNSTRRIIELGNG